MFNIKLPFKLLKYGNIFDIGWKIFKIPSAWRRKEYKKVSENSGSEVDNLFTDLNLNV